MSTSVFEIVGPIMVGPSSSHTAGMARIGMMAHRIAGFIPTRIVLRLSPVLQTTYRGHRSDAALVGGALGWSEDDPRIRDAIEIAEAAGVRTEIEFYPPGIYHQNAAQIEMHSEDGNEVRVRGVSVGGGSLYIEAVDEEELRIDPDMYNLLLRIDPESNEPFVLTAEQLPENMRPICAAVCVSHKIGVVALSRRPSKNDIDAIAKWPCVVSCRMIEPVLVYGATVSEKLRMTKLSEVVELCRREGKLLSEIAVDYESDRTRNSPETIRALMMEQLDVMKEAVRHGLEETNDMVYGLVDGRDAKRLHAVWKSGKSISGGIIPGAIAKAIGVMEYNASMGCIVAAPTAGSAGIVPGCLLMLQDKYGFSDDRLVDALFVSAIIGVIMAHRDVSFSGAVGGCQGEVGVSSAIAASGIAALFSDDPQVPVEAMAMAMKNLLGLVCDPVAGPVEVPCIKRNAVGVANAFAAAEMACAGIVSYVPPDEVIDALKDVQYRLPCELRATTIGGLACTKKAVALRKELLGV